MHNLFPQIGPKGFCISKFLASGFHNYIRSVTEALVPGEVGGSFCWCYIWRESAAASP